MKDKTIAWLVLIGVIFVFIVSSVISSDDDKKKPAYTAGAPASYCIKKETYGAFSEQDFERMMEYSFNKEYKLLGDMIIQHRVINIKPDTKIILVDAGFTKTVIRPVNDERRIWVVSEAVGQCR